MGIKIIQAPETTENFFLGKIPLDLTRKSGVLIRQSLKKADKNYHESRLLQENLEPIAIQCRGDADNRNIILYDEGAGTSGQKGYDERPKLSKLYLDIANDITGSLFVARPDRLFRDKHFINVSIFTELAERKKLILVVPGKRIYDFTKYDDLRAFQEDMRDAYKYIATHVQYMIDTRDQKRKRGLYVGGSLPAPYVIDRLAWKDEQVPIIYEPWLEPAIDLFTRFKAFDFSVAHICRYIESLPYIFRQPSFEDTKKYLFKTNMYFGNGGYRFSDTHTVKLYLSNLTLGGYMKIGKDEEGNVLLLPDAFDPAIPLDLLDECYASITGHYIDGTPFEGFRNTTRYMRNNPKGAVGLFHNLITSDQGLVKVDTDMERGYHQYYCKEELREEGERTWKIRHLNPAVSIRWTVPCLGLDRIVLDRLYALADANEKMADNVKAVFASMKGQEMDETMLLTQQVEKTTAQIARLNFLLKTPSIPLDEKTAIQYAQELSELNPKLERLTKKLNAQPDIDPEKTITNFYFVLGHVVTEFEKQGIDVQKQIMRKLVNKMVISNLSPHVFSLYIEWQQGVSAYPDVALLWRSIGIRRTDGWTEEEEEAIRTYWPHASELDVLRNIPQRSRVNIMAHANDMGIHRPRGAHRVGEKRYQYDEHMTYADIEAIKQYLEEELTESLVLLTSQRSTEISPLIPQVTSELQSHFIEQMNKFAGGIKKGEITAYFPLPAAFLGSSLIVGDEGERMYPYLGV